jgi:hypothetical protein
MASITTIQKGEIRENSKGKYIYMFKENQYYFAREIWDLIKLFMGVFEYFPADFREKSENWISKHNTCDFNGMKITMKQLKYVFKNTFTRDYMKNVFKLYHSIISEFVCKSPKDFWDINICNGDKLMVQTHHKLYGNNFGRNIDQKHRDFIINDECNVPNEDMDGKIFRPIYRAKCHLKKNQKKIGIYIPHNFSGLSCADLVDKFGPNYVPVIVKKITKQKIYVDYYKYKLVEKKKYVADWSSPRGKLVIKWGYRDRILLTRNHNANYDGSFLNLYPNINEINVTDIMCF